jgi:hypothetical protein
VLSRTFGVLILKVSYMPFRALLLLNNKFIIYLGLDKMDDLAICRNESETGGFRFITLMQNII